MVIFNSYVKLPEGISDYFSQFVNHHRVTNMDKTWIKHQQRSEVTSFQPFPTIGFGPGDLGNAWKLTARSLGTRKIPESPNNLFLGQTIWFFEAATHVCFSVSTRIIQPQVPNTAGCPPQCFKNGPCWTEGMPVAPKPNQPAVQSKIPWWARCCIHHWWAWNVQSRTVWSPANLVLNDSGPE